MSFCCSKELSHWDGTRLRRAVTDSEMCLTADLGVVSSIPAQCYTFVEIDREIISTAILLPFTDSKRVVVSFKQKYVHEVLGS